MEIKIYSNIMPDLANQPVELVERKGIGHPDTLADMIAMNFSNIYSNHTLNRFGKIPHHWADKVTIVGAQSEIDYGKGCLNEPMKIFQFGRVSSKVGKEDIDINSLFREAVDDVFHRVFDKLYNDRMVICEALTHSSSGPDHPKEFYNPESSKDVEKSTSSPKSNDTIILTSFTHLTPLEQMIVEVENLINSKKFKEEYPSTGYDVKVLAARIEEQVDMTICIPFIGERTPSPKFYKKQLEEIKKTLRSKIVEEYPLFDTNINLNTKDYGKYAYLTLIGTSCDKGGCGAVGRGNKYNGLITLNREMAVEAPAGKNPTHHSGRLYSEAIHRISRDIYRELRINNYVNLVARNGDPLEDPAFVIIKGIDVIQASKIKKIESIIGETMSKMPSLTYQVIKEDPIKAHIQKPMELYK